MDVGVHFYAAFLLSCFGMPANAFEYEVGEQRYCSGIDDLPP
jgi:hypothetical protein